MITVRINQFEGPLDLLLHLIEKAEVDIYDISVSEITEQYVHYIRQMQQLELEIASEFLVMAATLLAIKSKMLLPKKEEVFFDDLYEDELEGIDPREELIQRLIEYKRYKDAAQELREKEVIRSQIYTRPAENLAAYLEQEEINPVGNISLFDLMEAFEKVLIKSFTSPLSKIERDELSIEDRMKEIRFTLSEVGRLSFSQLCSGCWTREGLIVTFLALLELMKKNEVQCQQQGVFGDIWISSVLKGD